MNQCVFKIVDEQIPWRVKCQVCGFVSKPVNVPPDQVFRNCRSRGLGDTIAKITSTVGLTPCGGCGRRQEWLNKAVPYSS